MYFCVQQQHPDDVHYPARLDADEGWHDAIHLVIGREATRQIVGMSGAKIDRSLIRTGVVRPPPVCQQYTTGSVLGRNGKQLC